jgi:hypothetical protein
MDSPIFLSADSARDLYDRSPYGEPKPSAFHIGRDIVRDPIGITWLENVVEDRDTPGQCSQ